MNIAWSVLLQFTAAMRGLELIFISFVITGVFACNYKIKNLKIKPCDGKEVAKLDGVSAELTPECHVKILGCITIQKTCSALVVDWKAEKAKSMPPAAMSGKQKVCGETVFDTKFECPLKEGKKICATDKWVYKKLNKNMVGMLEGHIIASAKVLCGSDTYCFDIVADIAKA